MNQENNLDFNVESIASIKFISFETLARIIKKRISVKLVNKLLIVFISVMGVCYCAGINDLTVKGFKMQELSRKLAKLEEENKHLENESLNLKSMANVNERMKNLKMVAVGENVDYYMVGADLVARR